MVRQIDVDTLWVSLKEAEFSSRSRFCERRRLPIECRDVPSISTQNIDQNNQQKLFSKIFMFFIQTQKRQKNSFQFCPEIIIFIAFGRRKLFPCAACLLLNNDDVFEHIRCLDRGEHWQGVKCFLEGISDTSPTSLTHSHTQQPSQLKPTRFLLFP